MTSQVFALRTAARLALGLLIAIGAIALETAPARAQSSLSSRAVQGPVVGNGPKAREASPAPASALPGENVGKDRVIPAEHAASDMAPTEALFDAVNRGDLAAARDAIARGADFNARNELGQTPLDESIDLSRNGITFMLLSLRGGATDSSAPAPVAKGSSARTPPSLIAATKPPVQKVTASSETPAKPAAAPKVAPKVAPVSNDPGTPNPQRGFLGFGG